jgi:hypothetical protein
VQIRVQQQRTYPYLPICARHFRTETRAPNVAGCTPRDAPYRHVRVVVLDADVADYCSEVGWTRRCYVRPGLSGQTTTAASTVRLSGLKACAGSVAHSAARGRGLASFGCGEVAARDVNTLAGAELHTTVVRRRRANARPIRHGGRVALESCRGCADARRNPRPRRSRGRPAVRAHTRRAAAVPVGRRSHLGLRLTALNGGTCKSVEHGRRARARAAAVGNTRPPG